MKWFTLFLLLLTGTTMANTLECRDDRKDILTYELSSDNTATFDGGSGPADCVILNPESVDLTKFTLRNISLAISCKGSMFQTSITVFSKSMKTAQIYYPEIYSGLLASLKCK